MRVNGIHYFRLLLLFSIYMLGVLGIVASNGSGGGSSGNGGVTDCTWPVSGDNAAHLQNILDSGNNLILCPGQTYPISKTLFYQEIGQVIFTQGLPTAEQDQARLELLPGDESGAVGAVGIPGASLHHVTIDGMAPTLGRVVYPGDPLVEFGNSNGAYIGFNHIKNARGWNTLHCSEGSDGSIVEYNTVGPSGSHDSDPATDPPWSDGLTVAARDVEVAWNTIIDTTDVALNVFGASGSKVHDNTVIQTVGTLVHIAIGMTDPPPSFNYMGTEVYNNVVRSEGGRVLIGFNMGPNSFGFDPTCRASDPLEGASVHDNHLEGTNFKYGYVTNGVRNWTIFNNTATGSFSGPIPDGCTGNVAAPRAFACQLETTNDGVCPAGFDVITYPENLDGLLIPLGP